VPSNSAPHPEPLKQRSLSHPSSRRPGGRERLCLTISCAGLRSSETPQRAVDLCFFLPSWPSPSFTVAWSIWRFHISAPMWFIFLCSMPWSGPLSSGAFALGQPFSSVLSAASVCFGFAVNVTIAYVAVRFGLAVRHNRTFERDAPQAARPSM